MIGKDKIVMDNNIKKKICVYLYILNIDCYMFLPLQSGHPVYNKRILVTLCTTHKNIFRLKMIAIINREKINSQNKIVKNLQHFIQNNFNINTKTSI